MNYSDNSTKKSSILIVDDNPDNLRILTDILSRGGYKVRAALDGLLALRSLENAKPDLVLLDIVMPEMDGYQVCEHVKVHPHLKDIPIIFISALHEIFDKVKAFSSGGVDFITKPFKAEEVLARVKTHLEIYYLQNELKAKNLALEQEIAEHKKSQQQLRQNEERFRTLVNILPYGIVEVDVTGIITFSNTSYNRIFGFKADELNNTPFWMLATDTENFQSYFNQLIFEQPQPVPYISIQRRKEGQLIHVQIDWDYRRDNEGQLIGLVAVVTDITERVQAEAYAVGDLIFP